MLKGVDPTGLGLRGADGLELRGGLELRDAPGAQAEPQPTGIPDSDPSVVDLRHLDPSKPAVVDPRAARGESTGQAGSTTVALRDAAAPIGEADRRRRAEAAQRMSKTLDNPTYNEAFDAIRGHDYSRAIRLFEKARAELGDDKLVNMGLALARDLVKMEQRQFEDAAARSFAEGIVEAALGKYDAAIRSIEVATLLAPDSARYREELTFVKGMSAGASIAAERQERALREAEQQQKELREKAFKLAERAISPMAQDKWGEVVEILEAALHIDPTHETIIRVHEMATIARDRRAAARQ